ncbi:MAG: ribosome recycling factor [Parcubacteria group bacterium Gr01-1014_33]|nr:MAG: ribosome recycling factor [Parcubacteria group bacterium Gr01-1014_33]
MSDLKQQLQKITEHLKREIASLRTGRATPALVEDLEIDYYGSKTPLKAIASISSPDPKQLVIQPWDKNAIQPIEKAIQTSSLGVNPIAEKDAIRIAIPALTEERRKELAKLLGRSVEDARIQVRKHREDALREVDRNAKDKVISEDQKFRGKNEVQKIVNEANEKIDEMGKTKEREIMTV